jgi:hypothetical protein
MTDHTPDTLTADRPIRAVSRLRKSHLTRVLLAVMVAGLLVVSAPAPVAAQNGTSTDTGGSGSGGAGTVDQSAICSNGIVNLFSQAMILLQVFGIGMALLMTQANAVRRMLGQRSAEEAVERMAQVKKGTVLLIAGPPIFILFAELAGLPLLGCMIENVPLV